MVQGVGFRWFVRDVARRNSVSGWVRNLGDGSVEIVASGEAAALATLRAEVEGGPSGARVDGVDETELAGGEPLPREFEIRK